MRISIVGAGTVGQTTGIGFAKLGNDVLFYDIDKEKLSSLKKMGYNTTNRIMDTVRKADVLFVCVPTPTVNGKMDFSFVKKVTLSTAKAMGKTRNYLVFTVRSTVVPTTTRCRIIPILSKHSKLKVGKDFGVCMNPEFVREEHAIEDFMNPSRIVIGEYDKRSGDFLERLYSGFKVPAFRVSLDLAEMAKYVANCFLASKISYFNEIYMICRELGLDSEIVSEIASMDPRIGTYGVHGGRPFSGKCLPKDVEAFANFARSLKINPKLLEAILKINSEVASKSGSRSFKP